MRLCIALLVAGCGTVAGSKPDAAIDVAVPDTPT